MRATSTAKPETVWDRLRIEVAQMQDDCSNLSTEQSSPVSNNQAQQAGWYPLLIQGEEEEKSAEACKKPISIDDFEEISVLGKGSFGKVKLMRQISTQKSYAVKIITKASLILGN